MKKTLIQSSISAAILSFSSLAMADSCNTASPFISGSSYSAGDVVIVDGETYQCKIAGWCQSSSDFHYRPGSGLNWSDAWQEKSCASNSSSTIEDNTQAGSNASENENIDANTGNESTTSTENTASQVLDDDKHLKLDMNKSHLRFITVKKEHVAEVQRFESINGALAADGQLTFSIDLASVNTQIDIRDSRIQEYLFESALMPKMHFTTHINMAIIDELQQGQLLRVNVDGELEIHGEKKSVNADISIVKVGDEINVFSNQAMIIKSADFSLDGGIELLRQIASLSSIGETVPVYFDLTFAVENSQAPEKLAVPDAPSHLMISWNSMAQEIELSWQDNADNETGYVLQRREAAGPWASVTGLAENSESYSDSTDVAAVLQYRVFAMNDSVSSAMSNVAEIDMALYLTDQPNGNDSNNNNADNNNDSNTDSGNAADPATGANLYAEMGCVGCHGEDGQSPISLFNNVMQQAELSYYIETEMPYGNASSCEGSCADDIASYIIKDFY
ncbi:MAG: YceI family protein [Pseudomonadales bacterium]|nr:YceI family protein [Pseudomonadales bacterium]